MAVAAEFAARNAKTVVSRMDTFRHDSWQLLLERPALAFRISLFLRAGLKMKSDAKTKYDTRVSIGMGGVESISKRSISNSRGPAFTHSGKGLDAMGGHRLSFSTQGNLLPVSLGVERAMVPLLDCVVSDWSPVESRAVCGALMGWTQEQTSKEWPPDERTGKRPSRQAVSDSLLRAHWSTVESVLLWFESEAEQALGLA